MAQILIRTKEETKETLQGEARRIGLTLNALMILIIDEWVKKHNGKEEAAEKACGNNSKQA